ncbi:preprotein translocase subunit SecY [Dictyobacter vulcani]|uniref:preprotein translocase subunit SecY n=1 Tax=Dictyobacter vulcani TaxID=2607529 RepID=UPI0013874295|nr:preprotein translocase subunit SecY [Dictyobacter vulcani]
MWQKLHTIMVARDVRNKIFFTLAILLLVRVLDIITVPLSPEGRVNLLKMFDPGRDQQGIGQLFGLIDGFSGGSLHSFSIIALSVYPYITATIVMQLLQPLIPALQDLALQGEAGRTRLNAITRLITVPLAFLQAISSCLMYQQQGVLAHFDLFDARYVLNSLAIILALIAGVMILLWLGELINEKGIGNGISLIIFGGILATLPQTVKQGYLALVNGGGNGAPIVSIAVFLLVCLLAIMGMVYMYMGQRRVPIHYPTRRIVNKDMAVGQARTSYIPLQINSAGMIPLIFASSLLLVPSALIRYLSTTNGPVGLKEATTWIAVWIFNPSGWIYWGINALLVFAFTYFYAYVLWQQQNIAESLQKQGAFIAGLRPGKPTNTQLLHILNRITFGGAFFLALITILPFFTRIGGTQLLSSTSLLIAIGVVLDTVRQLEAELELRNYTGFSGVTFQAVSISGMNSILPVSGKSLRREDRGCQLLSALSWLVPILSSSCQAVTSVKTRCASSFSDWLMAPMPVKVMRWWAWSIMGLPMIFASIGMSLRAVLMSAFRWTRSCNSMPQPVCAVISWKRSA